MTDEPADDVTARDLERLAFRYAATLDNRDRAGFVALFAENAVLTVLRRRRDAAEILSRWTGHAELALVPEGLKRHLRTLHLVGNRLYDASGDEAVGQVYCVAHHIDDNGTVPVDRVLYIRYRDTYSRLSGTSWLIQERSVEVEWSQCSFAEI
jgi:ketosteroid isomerase-like protein